jgi:serine/threonine protein phosphatase PrpC
MEVLRRRLSVSHVDVNGGEVKEPKKEVKNEDRSLLVELSKQTVIDIVQLPTVAVSQTETDRDRHRRASFSGKTMKELGAPLARVTDGGAVGFACKKGLKPEAPNQDSFFIIKVPGELALYGVFDGHGPCGHDVSEFVKNELPKLLLKDPNIKVDPRQAMIDGFQKVQALLEQATEMGKLTAQFSGTTATVALHLLETDDLYIAHVGDSRAILARELQGGQLHQFMNENQQQGAKIDHLKESGQGNMGIVPVLSTQAGQTPEERTSGLAAADLTHDHKPDDPKERERIESCGGRVMFDGYYNYRVYAQHGRYPGLNMSRALGDLAGYYDAGLSPIPDIAYHKLGRKQDSGAGFPGSPPGEVNGPGSKTRSSVTHRQGVDKFMLICSDGVWEFISSQDAVELCHDLIQKNTNECAEMLARESWDRWTKHMMGHVVDDITVVCILF